MKDLHNKLQLEPIDEYVHSLADYLGCNEGEMLKELKQREQATINATLEYVREVIEEETNYWPTYQVPHFCINVWGEDKHGNRYNGQALNITDLLTLLTDNNSKNDN